MKRLSVAVAMFGVALALLLLTIVWYVLGYQSGHSSMSDVMTQMMGGRYQSAMSFPMPSYVWWSLAVLFALVGIGVAGMTYYFAFPEIKTTNEPVAASGASQEIANGTKDDWSVLLRTSKPDEKKVLDVLAAHNGRYLQKFIVKEAGLSRLKTHRIVSRFAERGIVVATKSGNTNEVALAPWLRGQSATGHGSVS